MAALRFVFVLGVASGVGATIMHALRTGGYSGGYRLCAAYAAVAALGLLGAS